MLALIGYQILQVCKQCVCVRSRHSQCKTIVCLMLYAGRTKDIQSFDHSTPQGVSLLDEECARDENLNVECISDDEVSIEKADKISISIHYSRRRHVVILQKVTTKELDRITKVTSSMCVQY